MLDEFEMFALDRVRHYAKELRRNIGYITDDIRSMLSFSERIKSKRDYLTEMEAELDEAEKVIANAQQAIKNARKRYNALPSGRKESASRPVP